MNRSYTKIVLTLVLGVGAVDLGLLALGFLEGGAWRHWILALVLALLGCLAWELVLRSTAGGQVKPLAWVAFPAAMLLGILAMPFLVLSLYPRLEGWYFRANVHFDEHRSTVIIEFPLAMELGGLNLRWGNTPLAPDFELRHPNSCRWPNPQRLELDAAVILAELKLPRTPQTLGINTIPDTARFRYASGDDVPEQTVPIKAVSKP